MSRYWFDSFPGFEGEINHPTLDPYGTPYGGPENIDHYIWESYQIPLDGDEDSHAPYTTVSQNRGGNQ